MDRAAGRTWRDKTRRAYARITQTKVAEMDEDERVELFEKLRQHENCLVALGFLQTRGISHSGGDTIIQDDETIVRGRVVVNRFHEIFDPNGLTRKYENMSPYARAIPDGLVTIAIGLPDDIPKWRRSYAKRLWNCWNRHRRSPKSLREGS